MQIDDDIEPPQTAWRPLVAFLEAAQPSVLEILIEGPEPDSGLNLQQTRDLGGLLAQCRAFGTLRSTGFYPEVIPPGVHTAEWCFLNEQVR